MFYSRFSLSWIGICVTLLIACSDSPSNPRKTPDILEGPTAAEKLRQLAIARKDMSGEQLAYVSCQTCHAFPKPDSFDKATWINRVFPLMGPRLGIYVHGNSTYRDFRKESKALTGRTDVFPDAPQLTGTEWQKLMDWYINAAPDQPLPQDKREKITIGLKHFKAKFPPKTENYAPMATVVKMDVLTGNIYLGNAIMNNLVIYDKHFKVLNTIKMESPPIHLHFDPGNGPEERGLWLTDIGSLRPTNDPTGKLYYMYVRPDAYMVEPYFAPIDKLIRPVHSTLTDLNNDQQPDIVISEFGWHIGALSWYQNLGGYRMQKHTLKEVAGAISSYTNDFDGNGYQDVIALMAQGNEGIFMFWNNGNNNFREQQLLKFDPSWGSSSFELADFNDDGFLDILYTGGDNGDGMKVLKKYHGIRIYLNNSKNQFSESWFFPLNGAYRAVPRDFDGDGDFDIAAISFFADYDNTPEEGFVYLENKGGLQFSPSSFKEVTLGRWMVMDVNDWDQDGDQDIVLGSFIYGPSKVSDAVKNVWVERGPMFAVLENTSKKK